jgi:hypothetical protein
VPLWVPELTEHVAVSTVVHATDHPVPLWVPLLGRTYADPRAAAGSTATAAAAIAAREMADITRSKVGWLPR